MVIVCVFWLMEKRRVGNGQDSFRSFSVGVGLVKLGVNRQKRPQEQSHPDLLLPFTPSSLRGNCRGAGVHPESNESSHHNHPRGQYP